MVLLVHMESYEYILQILIYTYLKDPKVFKRIMRFTLHEKPGISWKAKKDQVNIIFLSNVWLKKDHISHHQKVQRRNFSVISKYHFSIYFSVQKKTVLHISEKIKLRTFQ